MTSVNYPAYPNEIRMERLPIMFTPAEVTRAVRRRIAELEAALADPARVDEHGAIREELRANRECLPVFASQEDLIVFETTIQLDGDYEPGDPTLTIELTGMVS